MPARNPSGARVRRMKSKTIKLDNLARVEGEGALFIKIKDGRVMDARLNIFEPPRFFEAFLRGRHFSEVADITARICGICPVAYQMSAVHAIESAFGIRVEGQLRALRRLIYCGEWIESHALHIHLLHAPDFLGYDDAMKMAVDHRGIVERGLKLKKAGNEIVALLGGREIHPINVRVGGFYKLPAKSDLRSLAEKLKWAREAALETVRWTAGLPFPDFEPDYEFVSLRHPEEYPFNEGRIVSSKGLDFEISNFSSHIAEEHVEHSNALQGFLKGRGAYMAGPMARFNNNFDRLSRIAQEAAAEAGLTAGCHNPFKSIIVRSIETLYACDEALRIIDQYEAPDHPAVEVEAVPGTGPGTGPRTGHGCTEAPRGLLYHRYRIGDKGLIEDAVIVPPTSQNQKQIEEDLRNLVPLHLDLSQEKLTWLCEQAVRNYDPCISCATHFLKLHIDRV